MTKKKKADLGKEFACDDNNVDDFIKADERARNPFSEGGLFSQYMKEFVLSSGMAINLARTINIQDHYSSSTKVKYADFQEIIGMIKKSYDGLYLASNVATSMVRSNGVNALEDSYAFERRVDDATREHMDQVAANSKEMGSARQTVEKKAKTIIHDDFNTPGPGVYFLDEPESGISPMRHSRIEENINNMVGAEHEGSIVIIPTNSLKLFESDLPRIDLRFPERGIFRPSDYPGYFDINDEAND